MIQLITPEETYPLRRAVLRKNMPNEPHEFNGDFDENTFHLGFFSHPHLLGVVTLITKEGEAQLRGMAVSESHQGKGIGRQLVQEAEKILRQQALHKIWMNAREEAVPFYKNLGYEIAGPPFMIPPIGMHYEMIKYFDL